MRDVADAARVSLKTVSRVVNDEPGVREDTGQRVRQVIAQLGYRPNDIARSLRPGRTSQTVGLVIGDVANPFYSAIARSIETVARRNGTVLVTVSSDEDLATERAAVEQLLARRVDGLLIVPAPGDHAWLATEMAHGVQMVFLDRPPEGVHADTVQFDNAGGAAMAVEHLLANGYRRIALVGDSPVIHTMSERHRGYLAALGDAGVPVDPRLVRLGPHDAAAAGRAVTELLALPEPPDAIFACNNRSTIGALRVLGGPPRRLGLVGFDDFELGDLLGITVVVGSPVAMGLHGADLLFRRLAGDEAPSYHVVLTPRLVRRASAGARREVLA